ncbi:hypothetical protein B4U80_13042 [Leptotrombidium deliense]|uniref:BTB domain-containing protein n=1 Tax=Leptotrombidium deliense TaxID=299467 RepID=A0A443SE63_9ACAR|nr:hypothetical protein B4U80_13042 [Leptotrombidium deliense]
MASRYEKIFVQKLSQLLRTDTFNDIAFNCKDGKVSANRLVLSLYSSFLRNLFEENPNIVAHPLNDEPTAGINITEINVQDFENLLRVINSQKALEFSEEHLNGIISAARLMEIDLKIDKLRKGLTRIRAIADYEENPKNETSASGKEIDCHAGPTKQRKNVALIKGANERREMKRVLNSKIKLKSTPMDKPLATTVCPYCNITCKSGRGLQVHVGYIHKKEIKKTKSEFQRKNKGLTNSKRAKSTKRSEKESCDLSLGAVLGNESNEQCVAASSLIANDAVNHCNKNVEFLFANGENENLFFQNTVNNLNIHSLVENVNETATTDSSLMNGVFDENSAQSQLMCNLPADVQMLAKQHTLTLIRLPKTQIYEQIDNEFSCGICELKFPALPSLNIHMTYFHGLTLL